MLELLAKVHEGKKDFSKKELEGLFPFLTHLLDRGDFDLVEKV